MAPLIAVLLAGAQSTAEHVVFAQVGWTVRQIWHDTWVLLTRNPEQSAMIVGVILFATFLWLRFASSR